MSSNASQQLTKVRSKRTAGILGLLLGSLGVHRFYLGYTFIGVVQIIVTFATLGAGALWGFVEGLLILTDIIDFDVDGNPLV